MRPPAAPQGRDTRKCEAWLNGRSIIGRQCRTLLARGQGRPIRVRATGTAVAHEEDPAGHGHGRGGKDQQPEGQEERGLTVHRPKATRREPSAESWPGLAPVATTGSGTPGPRRRRRRATSASAEASNAPASVSATHVETNGRRSDGVALAAAAASSARTRMASSERATSARPSWARSSSSARSALRTCRRRLDIRPFRRLTSVSSFPSRAVATIEIVPVSGSRKPESCTARCRRRASMSPRRAGTTTRSSSNAVPRSRSTRPCHPHGAPGIGRPSITTPRRDDEP